MLTRKPLTATSELELVFLLMNQVKNRKIRSIRNLKEGTSGPERDAADQMLKRMGGPQLPFVKKKSKKTYG